MATFDSKTFRDRPINIDETGHRKWIYARKPSGPWYRRRTVFAIFLIAFLIAAPIIKINGNPLMLIDIANRKFSLLGNIIWAQDTYIMAVIMVAAVVFIVLFTTIFGRLWCGWACPQSLFLEMIYRRVEYLFDGNHRGRKPERSPATTAIMTIAKHTTYFLVTLFFTNVFLMWFTGPERLLEIIGSPIRENMRGFLVMLAISGFYYWIYAWFREQVCTMVCPYGRLQGVLLDSRSITVTYDYKRGEPRGARAEGDCIDCKQCLAVCPTGIDIRNGTQLECINCTACIDECNTVMRKVKKRPDLIRFDSVQGIETGKNAILNSRTLAYSIVLTLLIVLASFVIARRAETETLMLRVPGTMYQEIDSVTYSNIYDTKIINKSGAEKSIELRILEPEGGTLQVASPGSSIGSYSTFESIVIVKLPAELINGRSTPLKIGTFEGETLLETTEVNFIGPSK